MPKKLVKPAKAERKRTCGAHRSIKRPATVGARVAIPTPPPKPLPMPMPAPTPAPEATVVTAEPMLGTPPAVEEATAKTGPPVEMLYMLKGQTAPEAPLAPTAATAAMAETEGPPSAPVVSKILKI